MVIYNVQSNGSCNQLIIELINDSIYIEPSMIAYVMGNINFESKNQMPTNFNAMVSGQKYFKPKLQGTGKIFLHATLGTYHKFGLKDNENELILGPNVFIACRESVQITPQVNISLANFLTGVPMVNMQAKGNGNVMILMTGPVQEIALKEEKFMCFGHEVAAYSPQLKVSREIIGRNWPSGQKMARVFRGTGSVFFSPIPNKGASRARSSK